MQASSLFGGTRKGPLNHDVTPRVPMWVDSFHTLLSRRLGLAETGQTQSNNKNFSTDQRNSPIIFFQSSFF